MKNITDQEWTSALETKCFLENDEKRQNGVRRYQREDCAEGTAVFEKWLNGIPVENLETLLTNLTNK